MDDCKGFCCRLMMEWSSFLHGINFSTVIVVRRESYLSFYRMRPVPRLPMSYFPHSCSPTHLINYQLTTTKALQQIKKHVWKFTQRVTRSGGASKTAFFLLVDHIPQHNLNVTKLDKLSVSSGR